MGTQSTICKNVESTCYIIGAYARAKRSDTTSLQAPLSREGVYVSRTLYVGNLPFSATEETLAVKFARCGTVVSVTLVKDPMTGHSKRCGYIEMATQAEAQTAVDRLNLADYEGRLMSVNKVAAAVPAVGRA
jgi:RNA recognition motif-containing protein